MTLFGFFSAFKRSSSFFSLSHFLFFFSMKFEKITCPGKWISFALNEKFSICFVFFWFSMRSFGLFIKGEQFDVKFA